MKKQKNKGITLVALVLTVIIIIILATVAISFIFGKNGLITRAQQAKLQHEIETAREKLTMLLADAFTEKKLNSEYDENEFLDEFIKAREPNVYLEEKAIGIDGYVFGLDRSVPELGEYQGELEGPRIQEIKVTSETTNSASIEVIATNNENATYEYWYKNDNEGEDKWQKYETDESSNTCTISGLTQGEIYNIKVVVKADTGTTEKETNVYLGEMPEGAVQFTPAEWVGDGTATTTINTSEEGYTLQYQIVVGDAEPVNTAWKPATPGQTIDNLHHNETVYGRLWDGTNESKVYATTTVNDEENPEEATISLSSTSVTTGTTVTATVTHTDNESGANISACKYIWNTSSTKLGTDASKYTGGTFNSNGEKISKNMSSKGTYYLHVLTVDNAGNATEKVSDGITVRQLVTSRKSIRWNNSKTISNQYKC